MLHGGIGTGAKFEILRVKLLIWSVLIFVCDASRLGYVTGTAEKALNIVANEVCCMIRVKAEADHFFGVWRI